MYEKCINSIWRSKDFSYCCFINLTYTNNCCLKRTPCNEQRYVFESSKRNIFVQNHFRLYISFQRDQLWKTFVRGESSWSLSTIPVRSRYVFTKQSNISPQPKSIVSFQSFFSFSFIVRLSSKTQSSMLTSVIVSVLIKGFCLVAEMILLVAFYQYLPGTFK